MSEKTLPPEALDAWAAALRERFDLAPDDLPIGLILDLARDVAHGVARPAAPFSAFVAGLVAGRAGGTPEDTAAAVASGVPNNAFSQATSTASPARSSMQDNAGIATLTGADRFVPPDAGPPSGPKPRNVAATATPIASSVMIVRAPFATDFSARSSVKSMMIVKNPAAARVSHIGNAGERQS